MKKRYALLTILALSSGMAFLYLRYIYGWMEFRKNRDTPKMFLSHVVNRKEDYNKDEVKILNRLQYFLKYHQQSFYTKVYFDSTQLIVDTLIYSGDLNKLAVFVITKNPTYRQAIQNNGYDWYYDGYCYLGIKEKDTIYLSWINPGFGHSYDKQNISNKLKTYYFRLFAARKDTNGQYKYGYNLNDTRFWNCRIWNEINEDILRQKKIEEEKKNHPENIYESQ